MTQANYSANGSAYSFISKTANKCAYTGINNTVSYMSRDCSTKEMAAERDKRSQEIMSS